MRPGVDGGLVALGGSDHPLRRSPHVLLTAAEVETAVADLVNEPNIVIDVETTRAKPRLNELRWVGLGASGRSFLIPARHPKGVLLKPERRERTAACVLYPNDDRGLTKLGKPSMRMIEHTVAAEYASPPQQLFAHEVCEIIRPLLWSDTGKIGHNLKFDLMSLAKYYDHEIPPGPYHDTIVLRHVLIEDLESYKLKDLVCEWFKIHWKKRQAFYPNLGEKGTDNFGLDEVARYLAKDVRYCWMMFQAFHPMLERKGVQAVYDFEMLLYPVVMDMEYAGMPVDLTQMDAVRVELTKRLGEVEQQVWKMAGDQFSLSHTESKRWVMFGEGKRAFGESKRPLKTQNLKVRDRTPETRQPAVTASVLEYYSDRGNEMAELFMEWSALEKLRGTFIEGLSGHLLHNGDELPTVHTSFKQHGTVTGRFSAGEPNIHQLPREVPGRHSIRALFVAGQGYYLIVADYDQIELRCAGFLSRDPAMLRIFLSGEDIHRRAASAMYQIASEDITSFQRSVGKTQNFAVLYGAGEDKIARVAGSNKRYAARLIANYYDEFAYLEPWKDAELRAARDRGDRSDPLFKPPYVEILPNGRRRRLPDLYNPMTGPRQRAERQAINALVQGFASNITKLAMLDLYEQLQPYPAQMLAQVHDEIVVRVEKDALPEVQGLVERVMTGVLGPAGGPILGEIPLVASAAFGASWAEAKA